MTFSADNQATENDVHEGDLDRLRELQLELEQTRSEAAAARLDARAALLELRIERLERQIVQTRSIVESRITDANSNLHAPAVGPEHASRACDGDDQANPDETALENSSSGQLQTNLNTSGSAVPLPGLPRMRGIRSAAVFIRQSDEDVRSDQHRQSSEGDVTEQASLENESADEALAASSLEPSNQPAVGSFGHWDDVAKAVSARQASDLVGGHASESDVDGFVKRSKSKRRKEKQRSGARESSPTDPQRTHTDNSSAGTARPKKNSAGRIAEETFSFLDVVVGQQTVHPPIMSVSIADRENVLEPSEAELRERRRRKGRAWFVSFVVHVLIILGLGIITFSTARPRDQEAISCSFASNEVVEIESINLESQEIETTEAEPQPSEVETEISEVGEFQASELVADIEPSVSDFAPVISESVAASAMAMSMSSDSKEKMQFCGIEGGGNHFVYLLDSSKSMGDAFTEAREELLQSINLLKPTQRFYVVFFDEDPEFMRLADPNVDEPRSVYATAENKALLRQWAMGIEMDRGKAPYDIIPFAIDMRPDVVFLLSDGEFPKRIEEIFQETNRMDNLFGDDGPISIVHTIGYHSRSGETGMKRIAVNNGGHYRYVPKK
ncbi:VWA domain-containing protein [Stieleria sp. JC731]|uniref:vWA domain-containing protein n=1 Tax=Pirellulaceae TaxID=2691357 RepID=UPI001E3BFCFB|nr:vWA domain-containing protein [Stieleria sp. JC731]MCC9601971.1 VWA domain-containing protein [Stieleria sp. JC731]